MRPGTVQRYALRPKISAEAEYTKRGTRVMFAGLYMKGIDFPEARCRSGTNPGAPVFAVKTQQVGACVRL